MTHFETNRRTRLIAKVGAAAVIAVVGSALLALPQTVRVRAAADENVKVTNTAASPVPVVVQGTTGVGGTVQSQQSGAWNVGIAGTPTFIVANSPGVPLLTHDVDSPRQAYQQSTSMVLEGFVGATASFNVPPGQLAVIQHVSARGPADTGTVVQAFVRCISSDNIVHTVDHSLVLTPQGDIPSQGVTFFATSQPISCTASSDSPNPTLSIHVGAVLVTGIAGVWNVGVSGYLVTP